MWFWHPLPTPHPSPTVSTKLYECYYLCLSVSLPLPLWDTSADGPSSVPGSLLIAFVLFLQPVEGGAAVGSRAAVWLLAWRWLAPSGEADAAGGIFNTFLPGNGVQTSQIELDASIIVHVSDFFPLRQITLFLSIISWEQSQGTSFKTLQPQFEHIHVEPWFRLGWENGAVYRWATWALEKHSVSSDQSVFQGLMPKHKRKPYNGRWKMWTKVLL